MKSIIHQYAHAALVKPNHKAVCPQCNATDSFQFVKNTGYIEEIHLKFCFSIKFSRLRTTICMQQ
jgi:predicted acyl esterase